MVYKNNDEEHIRKNWFPRHQATLYNIGPANERGPRQNLIWQEPNTNIYRVDYLTYGRHLIVVGDIGEAVYAWSCYQTMEWISALDLGYFASKCEASEKGRRLVQWSPQKAEEGVLNHLAELAQGKGITPLELQLKFIEAGGKEALEGQDSWGHWLHEDCCMCNAPRHDNNGTYFFFQDFWECIPRIGEEIDIRCRGHLLGLRMALLESAPTTQPQTTEKT